MKTKKIFFALAILGALAFTACTPNSLNDDEPQQVRIDKIKKKLPNG